MLRRWHLAIAWTMLILCLLVSEDQSTTSFSSVVGASSPKCYSLYPSNETALILEPALLLDGQKSLTKKDSFSISKAITDTSGDQRKRSKAVEKSTGSTSGLEPLEDLDSITDSNSNSSRIKREASNEDSSFSNMNFQRSSQKMFKRFSVEASNPADENEAEYMNVYDEEVDPSLLNDEVSVKRNRLEDVYPEVLDLPQQRQRSQKRAFGVINPRSIQSKRRRKPPRRQYPSKLVSGRRRQGISRKENSKAAKNSNKLSNENRAHNQALRRKVGLRSSNEHANSGVGGCEETEDECKMEPNMNDRYKRRPAGRRKYRPYRRKRPTRRQKMREETKAESQQYIREVKNLLGNLLTKVDDLRNLMSKLKQAGPNQNQISSSDFVRRSRSRRRSMSRRAGRIQRRSITENGESGPDGHDAA